MSELEKLLPCPFCGGEPILQLGIIAVIARVYCSDCECATSFFSTEKEATDRWNMRQETLEQLEEMLYKKFKELLELFK